MTNFLDLNGLKHFYSRIKGANDGVFIMFHRKSDNTPLAVKPDNWTSRQSSGEIADGVMLVEGGKILVIAPTEASSLRWSSAAISAGGATTTDRVTALNDFSGKQNTASQVTHTQCSGTSYAPGYCHAYARKNANGQGLTAGKWWLPSMGELMMIYANKYKVNYALSLINGASQLTENWYWSSTEANSSQAWYFYPTDGTMISSGSKTGSYGRVRAVSTFLQ